ncbi:MAG: hypothetical protein ACFFA6_16465 [Promethearchaeota archaeon]
MVDDRTDRQEFQGVCPFGRRAWAPAQPEKGRQRAEASVGRGKSVPPPRLTWNFPLGKLSSSKKALRMINAQKSILLTPFFEAQKNASRVAGVNCRSYWEEQNIFFFIGPVHD